MYYVLYDEILICYMVHYNEYVILDYGKSPDVPAVGDVLGFGVVRSQAGQECRDVTRAPLSLLSPQLLALVADAAGVTDKEEEAGADFLFVPQAVFQEVFYLL